MRSSGRDGYIGIKVPLYMEEIGLVDIKSRKSDRVAFISPGMDPVPRADTIKGYRANGFGQVVEDDGAFLTNLVQRGLTHSEAARQLSLESALNRHFNEHQDSMYFSFSPNMILSSARVATTALGNGVRGRS